MARFRLPEEEARVEERRGAVRVPFYTEVECLDLESGTCHKTFRLTDISRSGAFLDSVTPFRPGTVVRLTFNLPSLRISVDANVVNVMPNMGMGLRFHKLTAAQQIAIDEILEQHASGR